MFHKPDTGDFRAELVDTNYVILSRTLDFKNQAGNKATITAFEPNGVSEVRLFNDGNEGIFITDGGGVGIGAFDDQQSYTQQAPVMVSNLRIVKGTAVYTAAFTPPTSPLTAISNTKLLCCQSAVDITHLSYISHSGNAMTTNSVDSAGQKAFAVTGENWDDLLLAVPLEGHPHSCLLYTSPSPRD